MQQAKVPLAQIIIRYDAPLQRYARMLVKHQAIAEAIVKEVFELVYDLNGFEANNEALRFMFKKYTLKIASLWLLAQPEPQP